LVSRGEAKRQRGERERERERERGGGGGLQGIRAKEVAFLGWPDPGEQNLKNSNGKKPRKDVISGLYSLCVRSPRQAQIEPIVLFKPKIFYFHNKDTRMS
jgi:hypothetical protein